MKKISLFNRGKLWLHKIYLKLNSIFRIYCVLFPNYAEENVYLQLNDDKKTHGEIV